MQPPKYSIGLEIISRTMLRPNLIQIIVEVPPDGPVRKSKTFSLTPRDLEKLHKLW